MVDAHESRDPMLTAGLSGLPQVQEHAGRAIDAVTGRERRPDQAKQPSVLLRVIRQWMLEPPCANNP